MSVDEPLTIAEAHTAQITVTCNGSLAPGQTYPAIVILNFTTNDPAHRTAAYLVECTNLNPTATPIPTVPTPTPPSAFLLATPYPTASARASSSLSSVIAPDNIQRVQVSAIISRGHINQVTWSHDRTRVAVTSGTGIWLYNADALDGPGQHMQGYDGPMASVIFSPTDSLMASVNDTFGYSPDTNKAYLNDTVVILWDTKMASARAVLTGISSAYRLAFSPDEKTLATANWNTISLWDVTTGTKRLAWQDSAIYQPKPGDTNDILSLAFSPDGKFLASGDSDGVIRQWDPETGAKQGELGMPSEPSFYFNTGVTTLVFSPDGKNLASSGTDGYVRIWDVQKRIQRAWRGFGQAASIDFSADGRAVAFLVGATAAIWQFNTNQPPVYLDPNTQWQSLVFGRDGKPLALGIANSAWRVWERPSNSRKKLFLGYDFATLPIAFGMDAKRLAINGGALLNLENNQIEGVAGGCIGEYMTPSQNGQFFAAWSGACGGMTVWDSLHNQSQFLNVPGNVYTAFKSAAFSPDNKLLATASDGWPGEVRLWDVQSGNPQTVVLQTKAPREPRPCGVNTFN